MACKWRRHDPLVMRFMQLLVDQRVVQAPVDPIDAEVGEEDEQGKLEEVI